MTGTEIFMLVIAVVCVVMLWIMIVWPVALIGTLMVAACIWGTMFDNSYICEQMPNDPYCIQDVEDERAR